MRLSALAPLLLAPFATGATPPAAFQPWFAQDGVSVEIARVAPTPWIRATATLDASVSDVSAVLLDFDDYKTIFAPMFERADVIERRGGVVRLHAVWPFPWPLHDRDGIFAYRATAGSGGTWSLAWTNGAEIGDPGTGVRIDGIAGSTHLRPAGEGCELVYTYLGDLGGSFGKKASEKAWHDQPLLYIGAIRKRLAKKK